MHADRIATLRILDANANRAAEGLRAVEEYARFACDDAHLSLLCKQLRHELTALLARLPAEAIIAARETQADVGTTLATEGERTRVELADVARANCKRVEQALRCLEEYAKLVDAEVSTRIRNLRYRAYTLARAFEIGENSRQRLATALLYVLVDGRASEAEFASLVSSLIEAGVHVLQLRDKELSDRELLGRARLLRQLTQAQPALMIINDRPDLAALSAADGVHVGQDELCVKDVRAVIGPEALVGVSTHNIRQARQAVLDGANYIGCGPVFPTPTKAFEGYPSLEFLHEVAAEISLPAFAIGGICEANLADVQGCHFRRIAVSHAVLRAADPAAAARRLLVSLTR